jgi:chromosome segregation ATPase
MANQDLARLQREREKREAELQSTLDEIANIEGAQKREREEQERKQREVATLARKREGFKRWISQTEREIAELKARTAREIDSACEDQAPGLFSLKEILRELAIAERTMDALKGYEPTIR